MDWVRPRARRWGAVGKESFFGARKSAFREGFEVPSVRLSSRLSRWRAVSSKRFKRAVGTFF